MKRFFLFLLAFVVLMGSITCNADDNDVIVSIDLEEDDNDLVVEDVDTPIAEVDLLLGEELPGEVDLSLEEDTLLDLVGTETDSLASEAQEDFEAKEIQAAYENNTMSNSGDPDSFVVLPYDGKWYWPLGYDTNCNQIGTITSYVGGRKAPTAGASTNHHGIDIYVPRGTEVYCARRGTLYHMKRIYNNTIGYNKTHGGLGLGDNWIVIDHGDGYYTVYGHLSELDGEVLNDDNGIIENFKTGQAIGKSGGGPHNEGAARGPHLHFEILYNEKGSGQIDDFNNTWNGKGWGTNGWTVVDSAPGLNQTYDPSSKILVKSIVLNSSNLFLNIYGQNTFELAPTIEPQNAGDLRVAWDSNNQTVATVTSSGLVQAVSEGDAVITCAAQDGSGITASCKVTVNNFKLSKDKLDMYIGQNYTLEGWIGKTCVDCSFKSNNSKIVSVDKKGKLTAKKAGSATITATASKSRGKATCVVTVHPKPKKVSIKQGASKTLNIGDSLALSITYAPKDALAKVTWKSSDKKVATVSSDGTVTAKKEGTATITAKVSGMKKGGSVKKKIKITVTDPNKPTGISISSPSETVQMGETLQLSAALKPKTAQSDVSWKSSNKKIAKVSKKGLVTPVKVGTVTITATAAKKSPKGKVVKAKIKITVKKSTAPSSISVGTAEKTLHVGDQWQLDYKIKPAGAKASLTFNSSDETVATVNEKGIITANATGSASITVVTQNNKKASCKVTVLAEASGLQLDKESLSLNVGDTYQLTCFVSHGLSGSVTFSSSNAAVATVDANALITAVGVGEATITASMDNGAIATCEVTVVESEEEHPVVGDFVIDNGIVVGYTGEGGDVVIPSKDSEGNPVVGIDDAFEFNSTITGVTIPNTMTSIGFRDFYYCSSLTKVVIPSSVTSIEESAFSMCKNLTNVTIPDSVTTIGEGAFYGCNRLRTINLPSHLTRIEGSVFGGCAISSISIPSSVTYVGWGAFYGCSNLTSIVLPSELTYLGGNAFNGCSSLKSVNIPYGVTRIYDSTFEWCESLQNIIIPDSVTIIDEHAFSKCYSMTSIIIPYSIKSIGIGAFWNSYDLVVTVPSNGIDIGIDAFRNCKQVIYV